jgi:AcrR family transcriptional regulator
MRVAKIDRRVARTRASLQRAHLALIVEKGYEPVTVEDICAAADVGRSTFYAHYPNKEALHRGGIETLRRDLTAHQVSAARGADAARRDALAFSRPMFEHARDHLDLYRALAGGGGGGAIEDIRRMISEVLRAELPVEASSAVAAPPREFAVRFLAGAFMSVLTWWLDGGAKETPEEMDMMFQRLAADSLHSVLQVEPTNAGGSAAVAS